MNTPEPSECPACAAGLWIANCTFDAPEQADHGYYPHDWRDTANALEAENATLRDTLTRRSEALNRTGADNDRLRATIARVEKLLNNGPHLWSDEIGACIDVDDLRTALADQEPARD